MDVLLHPIGDAVEGIKLSSYITFDCEIKTSVFIIELANWNIQTFTYIPAHYYRALKKLNTILNWY